MGRPDDAHYSIHISDEMPRPRTKRAYLIDVGSDEEIASATFAYDDPSLSWALNLLDEARERWPGYEKDLLVSFCVIDGWMPNTPVSHETLMRGIEGMIENGPLVVEEDTVGQVTRISWGQKNPIELVPFGIYTYYQLNVILGVVESLNWDALRDF